jgi:hypothetical protein
VLAESDLVRWSVTLVLATLTGIGIPWIGMRALLPTLIASGRTVKNYRGRDVHPGLGLVWVFWLFGAVLFLAATAFLASGLDVPTMVLVADPLDFGLLLVGGAFVFGLIDDAFGSSGEKGFRGHVGALTRGRLTTGALKLLGIGFLSLFGGARILFDAPLALGTVVHALAVVAVLALSANTLNLFDLRPGRALKVYVVLSVAALTALAVSRLTRGGALAEVLGELAILALFCAGPLVAVYRYDVTEIGMLGDAGANGLGMWVGVLFAAALPVAGAVVLALVLAVTNLASERISFTAVIEKNRVLAAVDGWGRAPGGEPDRDTT